MSAIASFVQIPKTALARLRQAATQSNFHGFLEQHGEEAANYEWSGYVFGTLLVYLKDQHQIDLMKSEFEELSKFLCKALGVSLFIFTEAHKRAYLARLSEEFSEQGLRDYYNEFNATADSEAGKPMLDGIRWLRQSLSALGQDSVIIFSVG
jgi:hypothetical protein